MRILHVIPSVAPRRGGPTEVVLRLSRALAGRGLSVAVLATRADLDGAGEQEVRAALGPVPLELVSTVGPARLEVAPGLAWALASRLPSVDVVHVHTVFTFPAALPPLVCRAAEKAHVIRPAGTLDEDCIGLRSTRQKRLAIAVYARRALEGADVVQATSDKEAAELGRLAPRANVMVAAPGAVTPAEVRADAGAAGRRVGSLGRIHPSKQLEVLVRALPLLGDATVLALAGDGEPGYVAGLAALAESLGVARRIEWLGHVGEADKRRFLDGCDVLAFPSLHESFGVAVAEAMAAGRAVVVSPGVALADEIRAADAGTVALAEPAALAAAVGALLVDGEGRAIKAANARALALGRYGWDAAADRAIALYEAALARRRAR